MSVCGLSLDIELSVLDTRLPNSIKEHISIYKMLLTGSSITWHVGVPTAHFLSILRHVSTSVSKGVCSNRLCGEILSV